LDGPSTVFGAAGPQVLGGPTAWLRFYVFSFRLELPFLVGPAEPQWDVGGAAEGGFRRLWEARPSADVGRPSGF